MSKPTRVLIDTVVLNAACLGYWAHNHVWTDEFEIGKFAVEYCRRTGRTDEEASIKKVFSTGMCSFQAQLEDLLGLPRGHLTPNQGTILERIHSYALAVDKAWWEGDDIIYKHKTTLPSRLTDLRLAGTLINIRDIQRTDDLEIYTRSAALIGDFAACVLRRQERERHIRPRLNQAWDQMGRFHREDRACCPELLGHLRHVGGDQGAWAAIDIPLATTRLLISQKLDAARQFQLAQMPEQVVVQERAIIRHMVQAGLDAEADAQIEVFRDSHGKDRSNGDPDLLIQRSKIARHRGHISKAIELARYAYEVFGLQFGHNHHKAYSAAGYLADLSPDDHADTFIHAAHFIPRIPVGDSDVLDLPSFRLRHPNLWPSRHRAA